MPTNTGASSFLNPPKPNQPQGPGAAGIKPIFSPQQGGDPGQFLGPPLAGPPPNPFLGPPDVAPGISPAPGGIPTDLIQALQKIVLSRFAPAPQPAFSHQGGNLITALLSQLGQR